MNWLESVRATDVLIMQRVIKPYLHISFSNFDQMMTLEKKMLAVVTFQPQL